MNDHPKHYCGLFGIFGVPDASYLIYLGLYALQHRGEESCGIVTSDGDELCIHKDMGLVADVFNDENLRLLKGDRGIGHVRYSTTGSSLVKNAQPLFVDYLGNSLAVAHNGNLVNSSSLRKELERTGSIFQTTCDSEVIVSSHGPLIFTQRRRQAQERPQENQGCLFSGASDRERTDWRARPGRFPAAVPG
jgi:amidophosphoribosyltransferase